MVILFQALMAGYMASLGWMIACPTGCPSKDFFVSFSRCSHAYPSSGGSNPFFSAMFQSSFPLTVALVFLLVITVVLAIISVILTFCNWVVVYLIAIQDCKEIITTWKKYGYKNKKAFFIFCISMIGLGIMCLLFLIYVKSIRQDKSYVDTYYFGWV